MIGNLGVQSLNRAFDILEVIGNSGDPVTLKKIAETTGLPKTTVYRLLSNLENRNYVRCDNRGAYHLGGQLLSMRQNSDLAAITPQICSM